LEINYPSDNEASRIIGWYLVKFWYNNPQFKVYLEKAKNEWISKRSNEKKPPGGEAALIKYH
jgi:hypothetical protein